LDEAQTIVSNAVAGAVPSKSTAKEPV